MSFSNHNHYFHPHSKLVTTLPIAAFICRQKVEEEISYEEEKHVDKENVAEYEAKVDEKQHVKKIWDVKSKQYLIVHA